MPAEVFATTHWSVVLSAQDTAESGQPEALALLCQTYWPPLFAWLRRQGYSAHDAADLVQGFFERLLARDYLRDVAREKGRFRSFLLASLRNYASNVRRDQRAQRRGGGVPVLALDEPGTRARCEAAVQTRQEPETLFDRVWAETILERAARALRDDYAASGKTELYQALKPWLAREARAGEYAEAGQRLGMTEGAVAVAVHRLRQRLRSLVRTEVAHTVPSPADIDAEMRYLLRTLTSV